MSCQVTKTYKVVISAQHKNMLYFAKYNFTSKEEVHSIINLKHNYIFNKDNQLHKNKGFGHASENLIGRYQI